MGPETEVISGKGRILTAGGVDTHVHFLCPEQIHEAVASGVTTLIGGGTGPAEGSTATTVTPGKWHMQRTFEALDAFPVNIGLLAKGSTVSTKALHDQVTAGALGFKIHEDWGATPAVIDAALSVCEETGVQVALHADSLNEAGFVQSTFAATKEDRGAKKAKYRSLHIFHIEGAGGGHAPDMISLAGKPNVLPASTNPTRPFTVNTVREHVDMMIVCHHLNPEVDADMAFADSRIRPSTMAAEDLLHDMGAISMMSSDAQAMGRIGEMIMRTWQTAHVMKARYGHLREDDAHADNFRARRYVAKYTINPAITHGIDHEVGSVDRETRRPGAVGAEVLRRQAAHGHQGRPDLLCPDRRRQRFHPHPAALPPAPRLGLRGPCPGGELLQLRGRGRPGWRTRRDRAAQAPARDPLHPGGHQGRHGPQQRCSEDRHRPDTFDVTIGGATTSDVRTTVDGQEVGRNYATELPLAQRYFLF